jgi:hypothetical protein
VTGSSNTAVGEQAGADLIGDRNIAIGSGAGHGTSGTPLTVSDSIAVGVNSLAGYNRSVAIGTGVSTTRVGQVAVGDANSTYTLAGINSDTSKATQNGDTFIVTSDNAGNLATTAYSVQQIQNTITTVTALDSRVTTNTSNIATLDSRVGALETDFHHLDGRIDEAFEGAAMAMAMAGASLPADKNYAVSINWGNFEGKNAFAGTAQARLSENVLVHAGVGYGASTQSIGGRAGLTFAW